MHVKYISFYSTLLSLPTERKVQSAIQTWKDNNPEKKRTIILVSHRYTSIQTADKIVVIADGNVVEQGSHEELLEQQGTYSSLYRAQTANEN